MATLKTPGGYLKEISKFPPSVVPVNTAIPAFVGYTEKGNKNAPTKIGSLLEFEEIFGGSPDPKKIEVELKTNGSNYTVKEVSIDNTYLLYYAMRLFYANGGGDCFIVSVGKTTSNIKKDELIKGLAKLEKEESPTLLVIPEIVKLRESDAKGLRDKMLEQCEKLQDRFAILDVKGGDNPSDDVDDNIKDFRDQVGTSNLKYGAAYYPWLKTTFHHRVASKDLLNKGGTVTYKEEGSTKNLEDIFEAIKSSDSGKSGKWKSDSTSLDDATKKKIKSGALYNQIVHAIEAIPINLPPSAAMAGIYATVDRKRGVWKAPANVSVNSVIEPVVKINDQDQEKMTMDAGSGKSVNAIRNFTGKGTLVWGARTLDGNSNEWRYISVRRFFNMVEEATKKASSQFVFKPNDANTWIKVRAMIENFLTTQWRAGALAGVKPEEAFYVRVGLGETMLPQDVLNGKMIVEIGMSVMRPSEFIVLKFSLKMQEP